MRRREMVLGLVGAPVGLALAGRAVAKESTVTAQADLARRVRALADAYAAAWNASDMDAMAKLYADNVHWVNIVGMHWQGFAQVDRAHRIFFDIMFKGVPLKLEEVESVVPIAGGAAVAVIRWSVGAFRTPAGDPVPPSRDRMSLVLVPQGDTLVIAHGSNIQINEAAQHSNPIRPKD